MPFTAEYWRLKQSQTGMHIDKVGIVILPIDLNILFKYYLNMPQGIFHLNCF